MARVKFLICLALSSSFLSFAFPTKACAVLVLKESYYNGHTYRLIANSDSSRITWTASEAYAVSVGGHLVTVDDANENDWIFVTFKPIATQTAAVAYPPAEAARSVSMWLGLNDVAQEGTFVWSSNSTSSYSKWAGGQPQTAANNAEDYVGMLTGNTSHWHDIDGSFVHGDITYGVVEINAVPEPTSIAFAAVSVAVGWTCRKRSMRKAAANSCKNASA